VICLFLDSDHLRKEGKSGSLRKEKRRSFRSATQGNKGGGTRGKKKGGGNIYISRCSMGGGKKESGNHPKKLSDLAARGKEKSIKKKGKRPILTSSHPFGSP